MPEVISLASDDDTPRPVRRAFDLSLSFDDAGPSRKRPLARTQSAPSQKRKMVDSDDSCDELLEALSRGKAMAKGKEKEKPARAPAKSASFAGGSSAATKAAAERAERQAEAAQKKLEREQHLEEKRAWQEANKLRTSKIDTMKELIVQLESGLFGDEGPLNGVRDQLQQRLEQDGAEVQFKERVYSSLATAIEVQGQLEHLHIIRIQRKSKAVLDPLRRSWKPRPHMVIEDEKTVFVCLSCLRLLLLIEDGVLMATLRKFRETHGLLFHQIILLVPGIDAYFKRVRTRSNRDYNAAVQQALHGGGETSRRKEKRKEPDVQPEQLEKELMRLRIAERCFLVKVDKLPEAVQWICSMVADVGVRPYKIIRNSHLSFAADAKPVTGASDEATFSQMLQQIPRMTEPSADSIAYAFTTFRHLMDGLQDTERRQETIAEIANCDVATKKDGQIRKRTSRVGDAMAQRLAQSLTGTDPLVLMN